MLNSIKRGLTWFLDGLVEALADVIDRLRPRPPVRVLDLGKGKYAIEQGKDEATRIPLRLTNADGIAQFQPAESAQVITDADVDLVLPADELLVRTLDPLPAESRQYVDGIVRHQIERVVPWRADNVLYSYEVAPAGEADDRLVVRVAATARNLHAPLVAAVTARAPRRLRLLFPGAAASGGDVTIPLEAGTSGGNYLRQLRYGVIGALAALLLIGTASFGYLAYSWQQASDALEAADTAEQALRKQLSGKGPQETVASRDLRTIIERKKSQPAAVLAIEELSKALPDDTWLSELQISDGQMRVSGISQSVASLVPKVQSAEIFADPSFFSPTTRLPEGGDRFHLQVRLTPPAARK